MSKHGSELKTYGEITLVPFFVRILFTNVVVCEFRCAIRYCGLRSKCRKQKLLGRLRPSTGDVFDRKVRDRLRDRGFGTHATSTTKGFYCRTPNCQKQRRLDAPDGTWGVANKKMQNPLGVQGLQATERIVGR